MAVTLQKQYTKWLVKKIDMPQSKKSCSLVAAYLKLCKGNRTQALSQINRVCGTKYNMRRFTEWESGGREVSNKIKVHMQRAVLVYRFGAQGDQLLKLLDI